MTVAIGVDLGGTKLLAAAVGPGLEVGERISQIVTGLDTEALLALVVRAVREASESTGADVAAVGLGIPCTIDRGRGVAVQSVHLPLLGVPVAALMAQRLGLPVAIDNDGNTAVLAEACHGAAAGSSEAVMLSLGTGIAGGLVLGGQVYRGAQGAAPELGHMVIDQHGPPCQGRCPNRGCLELYVSGTALIRQAALAVAARADTALGRALEDGEQLDGPMITRYAEAGDPVARDVLGRMGVSLGVGICNAVNIFNPDVVVVGGGVIGAGELLLGPARAVVAERALPPARDHARIVAARFGAEAGMIGAALLAREALDDGTAVMP